MFDFEVTSRSYSIEIDGDAFLNLLNSESPVTANAAYNNGNSTLFAKLNKLPGVSDVDYDGHFGFQIILRIDADDDTDESKKLIGEIIDEHLMWCASLPKNRSE